MFLMEVSTKNQQLNILISWLAFSNHQRQIDKYYQNNVIGGEGSFVQVAEGFDQFGAAVINKIKREITVNIYAD
jgi:hypothetical protein